MKGKSILSLLGIFAVLAFLIISLVIGYGEDNVLRVDRIRQGLDLQGGVSILYEADIDNPTSEQMSAANNLLRSRLDFRGYHEATTAQEGGSQIRVDIPGVGDAEEAARQIGASAMLFFTDNEGNIILTGGHVASASAFTRPNEVGVITVGVDISFNDEGAAIFADATAFSHQTGTPIHIWMDGELLSSPVASGRITGGNATITGSQSMEDARHLAESIRQGSLPFTLNTISFSNVGARLGADALQTSVIAGIIGLALVLIFMALFYKTMGIAADIALVIYVALFLFTLAAMQTTLSLPGIAGLILSMGMATDANIVIFERIREEVSLGKSLKAAVRTGYKRALPAIIDSNITTLIAGVVLFRLGTGPIMGFAQMLIIGTVLSMFTSIFVTRIITTCFINLGIIKSSHVISKKQKLALEEANGREPVVENEERPFVQKRKGYIAFSAAIIAIGIIFAVVNQVRGNGVFNLDVEFAGGTSFTIDIPGNFETSEIEDIVRGITGESSPQVQRFSDATSSGVLIRTTEATPETRVELIDAMTERFDLDSGAFTYADVSAAVSQAMRRSAVIAIAIAAIGMLVYITLRFRDLRKGASAVLAQLHDVIIVLCVYIILRIPLNYAFIAVMLTTLGYSINSTIIVFDRIRENRVRNPKITNMSLINLSVTQTLRRTIFSTASSFVAVLMLYVIGVAAVRDFTLPIIVGLLFGAYSSVCLSGSMWYMFRGEKK